MGCGRQQMQRAAAAVLVGFYVSTILVLGASRDVVIPATSPLIMYEGPWTNATSNPSYMAVVNGSLRLSSKSSNYSLHFLPAPTQGNFTLWSDGINPTEIQHELVEVYTGNSTLDPTLREFPSSSPDNDHQILLQVYSRAPDDFFTLAAIVIHTSDEEYTPSIYGVDATIAPKDAVLVDSAQLNHSATGWDLQTNVPFSYERTLSRTSTVGSTVSLQFHEEVLNLWMFGTLSASGATLNISFPSNGQIFSLPNYNISRPYLHNTLKQAMVWSPGPISTWPGSMLEVTLTNGEFELDFIRYSVKSRPASKIKQYIIVIVVVLVVTILLCVSIFFGRRKLKSRRLMRAKNAEKKEAFDLEMDEEPFAHPPTTTTTADQSSVTVETLQHQQQQQHYESDGGLGLSVDPLPPTYSTSNDAVMTPHQADGETPLLSRNPPAPPRLRLPVPMDDGPRSGSGGGGGHQLSATATTPLTVANHANINMSTTPLESPPYSSVPYSIPTPTESSRGHHPPRAPPRFFPPSSSPEVGHLGLFGMGEDGNVQQPPPPPTLLPAMPLPPQSPQLRSVPLAAASEVLPEWSPPPPSYLTLAGMASEVRARGMIPLSQNALERLFERVIALRRENMGLMVPSPATTRQGSRGSSGEDGGGGGGPRRRPPGRSSLDMSASVVAEGEEESEEFEADLEALARQIAGLSDSGSTTISSSIMSTTTSSSLQNLPPKR